MQLCLILLNPQPLLWQHVLDVEAEGGRLDGTAGGSVAGQGVNSILVVNLPVIMGLFSHDCGHPQSDVDSEQSAFSASRSGSTYLAP